MEELELFTNDILEPNVDDNRTFEEYEQTILYNFITSGIGLIENYDQNKKYFVNGSYDENNHLAVFLYGYENNLNIDEVNNHLISTEVKKHKGVQLINVRSDRRMFECGETNNVWVSVYPKEIETHWCGSFIDDNGVLMRDKHNCTKTCYTYDYVWIVVKTGTKIPFQIIENEYDKIIKEDKTYYIKWINQIER